MRFLAVLALLLATLAMVQVRGSIPVPLEWVFLSSFSQAADNSNTDCSSYEGDCNALCVKCDSDRCSNDVKYFSCKNYDGASVGYCTCNSALTSALAVLSVVFVAFAAYRNSHQ